MNVAVFHTNLYPETKACVERDVHEELGDKLRWQFTDPLDPTRYYHLFRQLWALRESVIVIEQDMAWAPGALKGLWNCTHLWCAREYEMQTSYQPALGFTKFSGALMKRFPRALDEVGKIDDDGSPPQHYIRLDMRIYRVLYNYGLKGPHIHEPPARHLNPKQQLKIGVARR